LIVIGNKGRSAINRFLLGSVTSKVVHHAPCNVLLVK
jgi:nucleotide-binding universal stress UspA family protein